MIKKLILCLYLFALFGSLNLWAQQASNENPEKLFTDAMAIFNGPRQKEAIDLMVRSANFGYPKAIVYLSAILDSVKKNTSDPGLKKQLEYIIFTYRYLAALQGDAAEGMNIVAMRFMDGLGVFKSMDMALYWIKKSADTGNKAAKESLLSIKDTAPVKPTPDTNFKKPDEKAVKEVIKGLYGIIGAGSVQKGIAGQPNSMSISMNGQILFGKEKVVSGSISYSGFTAPKLFKEMPKASEFIVFKDIQLDSGPILTISGFLFFVYEPYALSSKYVGTVYCNGYEFEFNELQ